MFTRALYSLHFDEPTNSQAFMDDFGRKATCAAATCPTAGVSGMIGKAVEFKGSSYLNFVADQTEWDVINREFTIAAWIYPTLTKNSTYDNMRQGIVGPGMSLSFEFPELQRVGDGIRVEFSGDTGLMDLGTIPGVLTANAWNHVIASYSKTDDGKGQYVLYVNGVNKGGKLISPYVAPRGDNSFYIGCSYFKCVQDATLESIPFHGRVDELQVFPYAFSANQATGYYRSQSVIYDLRLDDPPGAYLYEEADGRPPAACPSDLTGCPLSGVPGRENQAALFDGVDDRLTTSALTDQDVTTVGLTMGAWVYPASASAGVHAVLSTDNGGYDWSIVRNGGKWAVYDGTALWDTGVGVQTNTWQHVAAVFNPTSADKITFYFDGFPSAKSATVSYDASSGPLSIGCLGAANGCFDGSIDEVFVQRKPLAALDIAYGLYLQAPDLAYHLEEGHGATQFRNDGLSAGAAACLDDACPARA